MEHTDFRDALAHYKDAGNRAGAPATNINQDLCSGLDSGGWWDRLPAEQKAGALREALDTLDADVPRDEWLPTVAACARSGAPGAYELCKNWSQQSARYDAAKFDAEFASFEGDHAGGYSIGTLINLMPEAWKAKYRALADASLAGKPGAGAHAGDTPIDFRSPPGHA